MGGADNAEPQFRKSNRDVVQSPPKMADGSNPIGVVRHRKLVLVGGTNTYRFYIWMATGIVRVEN